MICVGVGVDSPDDADVILGSDVSILVDVQAGIDDNAFAAVVDEVGGTARLGWTIWTTPLTSVS